VCYNVVPLRLNFCCASNFDILDARRTAQHDLNVRPFLQGSPCFAMSREKAEVYPLSWTESRSRLRKMLEAYLKEPVTKLVVDRIPTPTPPSRPLEKSSLLALWIRNDLDLYAGALLLSAALLALSCMAWLARIDVVSNEVLKSNADIAVYKTQLAASCLLLTGAALSLWMIRSRHLLWHNDCENAKRRIIRSFIRRTNRCVTKSDDDDVFTQVLEMDKLNLFGTSLNDSYVSGGTVNCRHVCQCSCSNSSLLFRMYSQSIGYQAGRAKRQHHGAGSLVSCSLRETLLRSRLAIYHLRLVKCRESLAGIALAFALRPAIAFHRRHFSRITITITNQSSQLADRRYKQQRLTTSCRCATVCGSLLSRKRLWRSLFESQMVRRRSLFCRAAVTHAHTLFQSLPGLPRLPERCKKSGSCSMSSL
jgi:hypothetical protein